MISVSDQSAKRIMYGQVYACLRMPTSGWMTRARSERPWLSAHPHLNRRWAHNTVYVAKETLEIKGLTARSGAGLFSGNGDRFTLTAPGSRSWGKWRLPLWFYPPSSPPTLSYHGDKDRWRRRKPWVYVKTVGRGQEFVFDAGGIPEANVWLRELFR